MQSSVTSSCAGITSLNNTGAAANIATSAQSVRDAHDTCTTTTSHAQDCGGRGPARLLGKHHARPLFLLPTHSDTASPTTGRL